MSETHEEFFEKAGEKQFVTCFYGCRHLVSLERVYQHFKARMLAEMEEAKRGEEP